MYQWDFEVLVKYWYVLLDGVLMTAIISGEVVATAILSATIIAGVRILRIAILEWVAIVFVEIFRNIPPLILLFWIFYCIPALTGWQATPHWAAYVALSLYATAYTSEIIRAGLESIDSGQWQAGRSIGLLPARLFRYVILPQAVRSMTPALINQGVEVVKTTTLASTIAFAEILYTTKLISDIESRPLEMYTVSGVVFVASLSFLSWSLFRLSRIAVGRT